MTLDPWEGVDGHGLITTGAHRNNISRAYEQLIADAVSEIAALGSHVEALYVYGSVATGQARQPLSDLDLLAVLKDESVTDELKQVSSQLSARYRELVREVAISTVTLREIFADTPDGLGSRCFIKHYCVPILGNDLRSRLESCRADPHVAWAFNHDVGMAVKAAQDRLREAVSSDETAEICRTASRRVTLAAASLASIRTSTWTTDRARAARLLAELYPEWAAAATTALNWCHAPSSDRDEVGRFLDGFASWVAAELDSAVGQSRCRR